MEIARFAPFREEVLQDLRSRYPSAEVRADEAEAVVFEEGETLSVLSLDKLYRTYVDLALAHPGAPHEEVKQAAQAGIDGWFVASGNEPLFKVRELPPSFDELVMMQKCIAAR